MKKPCLTTTINNTLPTTQWLNQIDFSRALPPLRVEFSSRDEIVTLLIQGLTEKRSLGIGNVNNTPTTRYVLGYYKLHRLLTFRSKLDINLFFLFLITIFVIKIH